MNNSIKQVKKRLFISFAVTSFFSAVLIFLSFAVYVVFEENEQTKAYLKSLNSTAERLYEYRDQDTMALSPAITAYYSDEALPKSYLVASPLILGEVFMYQFTEDNGFFIYYGELTNKSGEQIRYYLTVGSRELEFGDENWEVTIALALLFACFLNYIFRFALQKLFSQIMTPLQILGRQLQDKDNEFFHLPDSSIQELQHFTTRLNDYTAMKEELVKQEMMFAKYTSHEMRTPIAVILGAARLQGMSDDHDFQEKQRLRILTAAENMQETVEVMLNLVKRDNHTDEEELWRDIDIQEFHHLADFFSTKLAKKNLELRFDIDANKLPKINCPEVVLAMLLKNLMSNAIRSTESGHITLKVTEKTINIIDTGQGLNCDNDSKKPDEHGLGLLIVEHLCQRYHWQFYLTNNTDVGCNAQLQICSS